MFYTFFATEDLASDIINVYPTISHPSLWEGLGGPLLYIIIMPHDITDALGEQVWHEGESYEAYYVWRSIAKRVGIEYAQLIYYVIMAQREEP